MNGPVFKIVRTLVLFYFLSLAGDFFAQSLNNYTSIRNTGISYSSISGSGNSFPSWRNTATFTQDDNRSHFTNIGFDFWYNGTRYTQFCASTNGYIDFSTSTDDGGPLADDFGYDNTSFTNTNPNNGTWPAIAPFYDDLTAQGGTVALGTSIKYLTSGSAPNRTLTVEWINMAVFGNTTPSLNFQVQLVESSGIVIVNYSTMNSGTFTFSYSMGMNINGNPTLSLLKMLQAANGNTFSNVQQNNLSTMPAANSQYLFSPPIPSSAPGSLTFSSINSGGMTLNWTDLCTNEIGYVVYNSTDGVNYSFVSQTAANATSAIVTNLIPSTTYFWRVYAVTEGCLSAPLSGTQATTPGVNRVSTGNGNWGTAGTWLPAGVPSIGDNVTIANGHVVAINVSGQCNNLTVGQGAASVLHFSGAASRALTVNGSVTINSASTFSIATSSNTTHTLTLRGTALTNNGVLNFAPDNNSFVNVVFGSIGGVLLNGTGTTNTFNSITVSIGTSTASILDITVPTFSANSNFLNITSGTFKLSSANTITLTPFTAATTFQQNQGIWLDAPNTTFSITAGLTLLGNITVSNGRLNVGDAANEDLLVNGGTFSVSAGTVNVPGKFYTPGINSLCFYSQSGGTVNVSSLGSTNTTNAPFQISGTGSQFTMSGGVIVITREGGSGGQDLGFINTGPSAGSVTGGTLQIGDAASPAGQVTINSALPVGNLVINSPNLMASLLTNSLAVTNHVTISSGTLSANNLNMSLGGNWTNAGAAFVPGTGSVTFNSALAQTLSRTGGETFNHLTFTGAGAKTFGSPIAAAGNFSLGTGSSVDVSASNYSLSVGGNFMTDGTFNAQTGLVLLNGTVAQTIGGTTINNFYDLSLNNLAGATLTNAENLIGTLTLSNGTFNTNSQIFTMVSTATNTARIAQITGTGDITGNVTAQRFAPGGSTGWGLFGSPMSSGLTLSDWDDDIFISCSTCPDGSAGGFLSIYTYDETLPGLHDDALAYIPLGSINDPIMPGQGYWVYLGDGQFTTNNITLDVTGPVRKFNYTMPLNYTNYGSAANDGWNLICNPYPSPVSWTLLRAGTPGIDDAIYVYNTDLNAGSGGHASYVNGVSSPAVGSGGIGDNIPMWQGFYVHSTGATSLNATEAIKTAGNPTFLKASSASNNNPLLRLYMNGAGLFKDEAVLYIQAGATDNFDSQYDAYKLRGQDPYAPIIALENAGKEFQINGVAPISGNYTMPVKTLTGYAGTYTISAGISSFPIGSCINLFDKFTGITTDLKTSNYVFTLADTTTIARFLLTVTLDPLKVKSTVNPATCASPNGGNVIAVGDNGGPWNYYWKNSGGAIIKTSLNKAGADTLSNISGNYMIEINTVGMCDNGSTAFTLTNSDIPMAQFTCADTTDMSSGGMVNFGNSSVNALSYDWDFGDSSPASTLVSPTHFYNSPGVYTVRLISTSASGCQDTTYKPVVITNNDVGISAYSSFSKLLVKTIGNNEYLLQQELNSNKTINCKLFDVFGKLIINYGEHLTAVINLPVDLRSFSPGIYFVNITIDGEKQVIKLPVK